MTQLTALSSNVSCGSQVAMTYDTTLFAQLQSHMFQHHDSPFTHMYCTFPSNACHIKHVAFTFRARVDFASKRIPYQLIILPIFSIFMTSDMVKFQFEPKNLISIFMTFYTHISIITRKLRKKSSSLCLLENS